MIKQLIKDIAYDNIKLSQALTRAKLIENQIKNETFKLWINKELEGYDFEDIMLPNYRKIWSVVTLTIQLPFGGTQQFDVNLPESFGEKVLDYLNFHRIIEPIALVEDQIENLNGKSKGFINIPIQQTQMLANLFADQIRPSGGVINNGHRVIGKVQYQNVLEQTKQKLLDTLMELDNEFPELKDNYKMTEDNKEKVQNIITTNIYGSNNPTNIGVGNDIQQTIAIHELSKIDREILESYGVEKNEIEELDEIVKETKNDKSSFVSNSMKWLGSVSASIAARGFYEKLPMLTDYIHKLIQ